ncbi:MAG: nickel/cobalt transporter (NiCoT) family protein, partial [Paraburkholderia sp.]|nr:nickel/cobalt transporter (NiCoT) family protein [Paraburkholderia sp.]
VWHQLNALNDNFGTIGYVIIGIFALSWLASIVTYRVKRFDELEVDAPR